MTNIEQFKTHLKGAREVGLCISLEVQLEDFEVLTDPQSVIESPAEFIAFLLTEDMFKQIYDFCMQYPTGQVDMSSIESGAVVYTPDYTKGITILSTEEMLRKAEEMDFDFRAITGIALHTV